MAISAERVKRLEDKVIQIQKDICVTTSKIGYSHLGGGMSMTDMAVALYYDFLNFDPTNPEKPDRDRFILSKGHCSHCLYNIFVDLGMYTKEELWNEYNQVGGRFGMHPNCHYLKGIEASTGSLGHGLPLAVGFALAARMNHKNYRVIVMVGDGELDEGSNWEALMCATQYQLGNLYLIVDKNNFQIGGSTDEIMTLNPLEKRLETFGWDTITIKDGHNMTEILEALDSLSKPDSQVSRRPVAIISNTIKGKGLIGGLENTADSHIGMMPTEEYLKDTMSNIEQIRMERRG